MSNVVDGSIASISPDESSAFSQLVDRYGDEIYRRIARRIRNLEDVEDLTQEVFIKAFLHRSQLKNKNRYKQWLCTIADNMIYQWYRRRYVQLRWENMFSDPHEQPSDRGVLPDECEFLYPALYQGISRLSAIHREVINHHYIKGYNYQKTAQILKLELNTVRSRLQKARIKLKQEVTKMKQTDIKPQSYELRRKELTMLRWSTEIVSRDPERPGLGGVFFDQGGKVIATDGHRLFQWSSKRLLPFSTPLLIGPAHKIKIPKTDHAVLTFHGHEMTLRPDGYEDQTMSVLLDRYPEYERVIPDSWSIRANVNTADFLQIIHEIEDQLSRRHPVDNPDTNVYQPTVDIHLSNLENSLTLLTTRDMGYSLSKEKEGESIEYNPVGDWIFRTSIPINFDATPDPDLFRIRVDYNYLKTAISVFQEAGMKTIKALFNTSDTAMLFTSMDGEMCKFLQMPLRME